MMLKKTLRATRPSKPQCLGRSRLLYALCLLFVLLGCQASLIGLKPPLEEEGEVYLYIEPFPQEAERLRFTLEEVCAVSGDGKEIPFTVSLAELKAHDLRRQRLLAHGRLPPGPYIGLSFRVKKATLKVEEGEASLLLTERPVRIDFPFTVNRKRAQVISLKFRYEESITGGVSFSPSFSLVTPANPISSLAGYVTNKASHNITAFDKKLRQVVGVIATGAGPAGMALDQRLKKVYVALSGEDAIEVIDITAQEIINRIRLDTGDRPQELALTPDGRSLLVVNNGSNTVSFIDPISLFELTRINVGNGPNSILIDSRGRRAFVFNTLSSTITVLDIPLKAVVTTLSTDPGPLRGQFNRRGDRLYVVHEFSSFLTVIDPTSLSVIQRFPVRMGMSSIKVDPITDLVYLGRKNDVVVEVYDPLAFVSVDVIRTGGTIPYMAIDGEENNLYLVNPELRRLMVSNLVSRRIVYEIDVGEEPYWVALMGER
jgi:YVTN family beta-propeller protein